MQPRPLTDYVVIIAVVLIAAYFAHQFFPKTETTITSTTKWLHDTTEVTLTKVKYDHLPARVVHDTVDVRGMETIVTEVDTTFPDSAKLLARSSVILPAKLAWLDLEYQPAPQKVVTLEKIVTNTVIRTETTIDLAWVIGGVAAGIVGGIYIAHQVK